MSTCNTEHEIFVTILTASLTTALVLSFVSQHYKIITNGKSTGFSPWFLLLGSMSSTAAMLDIWTLQWPVVKCCRQVSAGVCLTSLGGIIQVSLQWILFNTTFILFLLYYPPHMKYDKVNIIRRDGLHSGGTPTSLTSVMSEDWCHSVLCASLSASHFVISFAYTAYVIATAQSLTDSSVYPTPQITTWATFLGITSAGTSVIQYLPQLWRTWKFGFVGALSIPMYCFQVPGAAVIVVSIALREGTDWTSWAMYAASGIMSGLLLLLCLVWKVRQVRLGLDDFGKPVATKASALQDDVEEDGGAVQDMRVDVDEQTPLLDAGTTAADEDQNRN